MPRLALGERRALEIPLDVSSTGPDMVCNRVHGPALSMIRPDLLVAGHELRPSRGGEAHRSGGRRLGRERHGRDSQGRGWASEIMHRRRRTGVLGIEKRPLGGVGPEHVSQHSREVLQQMEAVGHLARCGSACARRFRVCLRVISYEDRNAGMRLQPPCGV
jgi:hypothetical protein